MWLRKMIKYPAKKDKIRSKFVTFTRFDTLRSCAWPACSGNKREKQVSLKARKGKEKCKYNKGRDVSRQRNGNVQIDVGI